MTCAVPSCAGLEKRLVPFPHNEVLQNHWKCAIEAGSGLKLSTRHCGTICSWHFGEDPGSSSGFWEPFRFLHRNGKTVQVACCRLCLQFDDQTSMISKGKALRKLELVNALETVHKIELSKEDLLFEICRTCTTKISALDQWIEDSKQTEMEYRTLENAAKKSMFNAEHNSGENKNDGYKMVTFAIEAMEEDETGDLYEEDGTTESSVIKTKDEQITEYRTEIQEISNLEKAKTPAVKVNLPPNFPAKRGPNFRKPQPSSDQSVQYRDILSRKCYICPKLYENHDVLIAHLTVSHFGGGYECTECDKSFKLVTSFNRHLGLHDQTNRPLKCSFCPVGFKISYSLQMHENREHGAKHQIPRKEKIQAKNFPCTSCDKKFQYNYELLQHDRFLHQKLPGATCQLCGRHFRNRTSLRKHHVIHTGDNPYDCQQCDAAFKSTWNLVTHIARVHGASPVSAENFECDVCLEKFSTKPNLLRHIECAHLGQKDVSILGL